MPNDDKKDAVINGINMPDFEGALKTVTSSPEAARAPKKARVRWRGGFKFSTLVRNHTFLVDEPSHLTGEDQAPNAVEYVVGALGACLATGFILNASRRGIEVHNLEIALDSTQDNAFTFLLGQDGPGHSGLDDVRAKLFVQADAEPEVLRQIWELTVKTSPVGNSLARGVPIRPEVEVVP